VGDPSGVIDRESLGDETAHRPAEDVGARDVDRVHEGGRDPRQGIE
jgi:hypothetical protein